MNQDELEALLAQIAPNNDPGRLEFNQSTETVEVEQPSPYGPSVAGEKKKPVRVLTWVDRGTGQTLKVQAQASADGTPTYTTISQGRDPKQQGEPATTAAQQAAVAGGSEKAPVKGHPGIYAVTTVRQQPDGSTAKEMHYEDESGRAVPEPQAPAQAVPGTLSTSSPQIGFVGPDGSVRWAPNPNYQKAKPEPLNLPPTQKWVIYQSADGTTSSEKNPNYRPPSKIERDPGTGRLIEITEDDDGRPLVRPVTDQTTVKPADIPVLQAKYGQIGQSLGAYLQDLNGRVSRGEMTSQERDAAFKAAHQQASVQVDEINSILDNSKSVWSTQVQERNQQYGEAANRRSYASSIMNNAVSTGRGIAEGALPGHGRAIAEGVMTLMDLGQRYAQGMGGFPSMQTIAPPPALQQAASMNLPGFGPGGADAPGAGSPVPGSGGAGAVPNAIGVGAVGALPAPGGPPTPGAPPAPGPAGALPAPLLPPLPPVPGQAPVAPPVGLAPSVGGPTPTPLPFTGQNPNPTPLGALGATFGAGVAGSPIGVPAAAGGGGYFDRDQEAQSMLAASMTGGYGGAGVADPEWERAVRAAMGMVG